MLLFFPLIIAVVAIGWHFSSVLLRPVRVIEYPETVRSVRDTEIVFAPSRWAAQPGTWGVRWAGGRATVGPVLHADATGVRRTLLSPVADAPPPGTPVTMDAGPYDEPAELGLTARTVAVPGPLGDYPAWFVPADGSADGSVDPDGSAGPADATWVIAVHGRGADRRECLRVLPTLHRLGHPVLAVSYRNDVDAPASPDGHYHLGDTEWRDLAAAVAYARDRGATGVVLYGWSMGAAITAAYLDRAPGTPWAEDAASVRAVVWDSPLLDWRATLRQQAALRRLPPGLTRLATRLTAARIGIDFDRFDLVRRPPALRPPTLLFHGDADTAVPVGPARALAASAGELGWPLRYVEVAGAEHTAPWNTDPGAYEAAVNAFLIRHAASAEGGLSVEAR